MTGVRDSLNSLYKIAGGAADGTAAMWTPIAIDASGGYDRATVIVARGDATGATKGAASFSVYESATTGGSYALRASSLGTLGTAYANKVLLIEMGIDPTKPFLKVYGTATTTGTAHVVVVAAVRLYRGSRSLPPTQDIATVVC